MAASLATLAIETSRLYKDLLYRSEFDLLTGVQNRFIAEKKLTAMIRAAHESTLVFGLIYIDLDEFKRINDAHGHLVGDHFLQEVAKRMKHQLRPDDTLARIGGDEFAALIPAVHRREEVEVIARRLECCFLDPIVTDGCVLRGSASIGIALYPEDGDSLDGLLSAADASMYVSKHTRQGACRDAEIIDVNQVTERNR